MVRNVIYHVKQHNEFEAIIYTLPLNVTESGSCLLPFIVPQTCVWTAKLHCFPLGITLAKVMEDVFVNQELFGQPSSSPVELMRYTKTGQLNRLFQLSVSPAGPMLLTWTSLGARNGSAKCITDFQWWHKSVISWLPTINLVRVTL